MHELPKEKYGPIDRDALLDLMHWEFSLDGNLLWFSYTLQSGEVPRA